MLYYITFLTRRLYEKISSVPLGRLLVVSLLFLCSFVTIIIIVLGISEPSDHLTYAFLLPLLILFNIVHYVKSGYWEYLKIDDLKIANNHYSLVWESVHITLTANYHAISPRCPSVIMYLDDHYLNEDEISKKKYKMFMIVTFRTPSRQEHILSKYNKQVKIMTKLQDERLGVFLEHNKQFD